MRKSLRKKRIIALIMALCMVFTYPVGAANLMDAVSDTETNADFAEDTVYSRLRGNHLNYGRSSVTKLSSTKVHVSGITQCHHLCDTVYLTLSLERKVNGSYGTYRTWEFTANNVGYLNKGIDIIVPSGYYYRVRGYHAAKDGSKESTATLTKGILIN